MLANFLVFLLDPSVAHKIGWEYNVATEETNCSSPPPHSRTAETKSNYNQITLDGEPDRHLILITKEKTGNKTF